MSEWKSHRLGDFLTLEYGKPLDKGDRKDDGLYPAYGANGVKCRSDKFYCENETIIVGRKGSAGELTLTEERFWPLDVTYFVKFDQSKYDLTFIYYLLSQLDLPSLATGVKPGINRNNVYSIGVKTPPIPEQHRIVAILDQAFADIEKARANAEQNLKNTRELFDSYLNQVFSQRGEGYEKVELSKITQTISDGDHSAPPKSDTGIPFITISNINKQTNTIDFTNTFKVPEEYFLAIKKSRKPELGDILYTVTGSYGIPVIVKEKREFCFQRHIGLIKPTSSINSNWLYYLLMSPQVFNQADRGATGTAQKTVSLKLLRGILVPNIPLEIQLEMTLKIELMEKSAYRLEQVYTQKLASLDELKKSLLQKAFSGELTKGEGRAA
jgi:type I restriction enzyme S subunit